MKKALPIYSALIPEAGIKVFGGEIFDVYQWPQQMFDGSVETFEMLRRPDTVQIIAIKSEKLIFIEDEQPGRPLQIHVPGGRVDAKDESWINSAKRELREETGLEFRSWRLICVEQPVIKIEWFAPIFLATDFTTEHPMAPDISGERIAVKPYLFNEAKKLILSGKYPAISYLIPLFTRLNSIDDLISLPEFVGQSVDR